MIIFKLRKIHYFYNLFPKLFTNCWIGEIHWNWSKFFKPFFSLNFTTIVEIMKFLWRILVLDKLKMFFLRFITSTPTCIMCLDCLMFFSPKLEQTFFFSSSILVNDSLLNGISIIFCVCLITMARSYIFNSLDWIGHHYNAEFDFFLLFLSL